MATVIGAPIRLRATFADSTGAGVDPTAVSVVITPPTGAATSTPAVRDGAGSYHLDVTPMVAGIHQFYFVGTGANASTQPADIFTVSDVTTGAMISLADAKEQLNKSATSSNPGSTDDAELMGFIRSASYAVNHMTGYTVRTGFSEWLTPDWGTPGPNLGVYGSGYVSLTLARSPVLSVESITPMFYGVAALSLVGVSLDGEAGVLWLPTNQLFLGPCTVQYTAGRSFVPANLQSACRVIVQHLWDTQRGPAVKGFLGGDDTVMVPGIGFAIPSRAVELMAQSPFHAAPGFA
jgi:hypothetical protein